MLSEGESYVVGKVKLRCPKVKVMLSVGQNYVVLFIIDFRDV